MGVLRWDGFLWSWGSGTGKITYGMARVRGAGRSAGVRVSFACPVTGLSMLDALEKGHFAV